MEEMLLTPDKVEQAGGVVVIDQEGRPKAACSAQKDLYSNHMSRKSSSSSGSTSVNLRKDPSWNFRNDLRVGEIEISVYFLKAEDGASKNGSAAILPIFNQGKGQEAKRLTFEGFYSRPGMHIGGRGPTVNGKLLFGVEMLRSGIYSARLCPQAIHEIIRVTGIVHTELTLDLFTLSMTVRPRLSFSLPSTNSSATLSNGFEIGKSRKFRIQPEWMVLAAILTVILSYFTSRLNETDVRMARVYRERNNFLCACSPIFLDEENVIEGTLFERENEYHWGEYPGEQWEKMAISDEFFEDAILV